ncbi:hypothetical protein [Azospirillum rugosum]|uniref:Uncharacterized protein n=1 Tax=Azospirillum rugosum TaxID=416170 RepID=A0ABS4SLT4_9PROT|nr:hypothetical protein [Azospirillum rugosum]MBP2293033.1 hypothetical protein [Azospirillum rugosum]MDQ0526582.1 hypothetical protein [Azospirillum rugosum]
MLPAHLAARLLEQRRAEQSAEFARQLPLYAEDMPLPPDGDDDGEAPRALPDWATNY